MNEREKAVYEAAWKLKLSEGRVKESIDEGPTEHHNARTWLTWYHDKYIEAIGAYFEAELTEWQQKQAELPDSGV